jgi:hypothetical protein
MQPNRLKMRLFVKSILEEGGGWAARLAKRPLGCVFMVETAFVPYDFFSIL